MEAETATPRARAAWAFSGLDQRELADRAGLHYDRLRAILARTNHRDVTLDELRLIADATGVPHAFMDAGWASVAARPDELLDRVHRVEARLAALEAEARARSAGKGRSTQGQAH